MRRNLDTQVRQLKRQLQKKTKSGLQVRFMPHFRQLQVMNKADLPRLERLAARLEKKSSGPKGVTFRICTGRSKALRVDFHRNTVTADGGAVESLDQFIEAY